MSIYALSINDSYNQAFLNLSDTFEQHGIHVGVLEALVATLNSRRNEYVAIDCRNQLVRTIALAMDNRYREHVATVFGSPGPTHDALQEFLDAWLDWADSNESSWENLDFIR